MNQEPVSLESPPLQSRSLRRRARYGGRAADRVWPRSTPPPARVELVKRDVEQAIGDCGVYEPAGRVPGRVPLDQAVSRCHANDAFVWVGLQQPTAADIADVARTFALPELAVEDAVRAHQRPKLEVYGDVVFVILKPVHYVDHEHIIDVGEIALFLGPGFVVTVRHGASTVLGKVRRELDAAGAELLAHGPAAVLYRTADLIVDGYEDALDSMTADIDDVESRVFTDNDDDLAERIYALKREIAEFRRAVAPLVPALERLAAGAVPELDTATGPLFRDVHDHLQRAADAIEADDRLLSDVLQANVARVGVRHSQIAVRQNEDMRKISAYAAIALVPTAIAGIYGMNFENMPELEWEYGYFLVLGLIAGVCAVLYRLFRRNGWL